MLQVQIQLQIQSVFAVSLKQKYIFTDKNTACIPIVLFYWWNNYIYCYSATVHITVVDINEYAPAFLEPSYVRQVDEGRLYQEIVRVEASDRDCTPKFGDICKYEILTSDQPFTIDNEGWYMRCLKVIIIIVLVQHVDFFN